MRKEERKNRGGRMEEERGRGLCITQGCQPRWCLYALQGAKEPDALPSGARDSV
jgi:hypothetical protein